jgi:murein L,D-transpeptidase YafK
VSRRNILRLGIPTLLAIASLCAFAWIPPATGPTESADKVLVLKNQHKLILLKGGRELCSYSVALGRNPRGPKTREGDHKTPEGTYVLDSRNSNSGFHLALHISYPNADDQERALAAREAPGGEIMIHGIKNGLGWIGRLHRFVDWTNGCIAVTNQEMDQIWKLVGENTPIEIRP